MTRHLSYAEHGAHAARVLSAVLATALGVWQSLDRTELGLALLIASVAVTVHAHVSTRDLVRD